MHTVLPDPASDRVTIAMSTGGVYVSEDGGEKWEPRNRGITVVFGPDPLPEYGQCVHKVAVDAGGPDRHVRAEPLRGLPHRRRRRLAGRRSPAGCRPTSASRSSPRRTTPGHGVGGPAGGRHAAGAAGRPAARAPHPRRRGDVDRAGRGPARRRVGGGHARRVLRRRRATPPASTSAPATAASTPAPTRATRFTLVADHLPDVLTVTAATLP